MEGKEVRFGIANSALWATATTAATNGSVNSMHDSYTPLGGLIPMWLIQLGEVIFGGVGSGLYGMLVFAIIAVFVAGLMVGRTPEYLGKKIEAFEMKMAIAGDPDPAGACVLIGAAVAVCTKLGDRRGHQSRPARVQPDPLLGQFHREQQRHRAFAGLGDEQRPLQHRRRSADALRPLLADRAGAGDRRVAGGERSSCPPSPAQCRHIRRCLSALLVGTVILVGALTFIPALALGRSSSI